VRLSSTWCAALAVTLIAVSLLACSLDPSARKQSYFRSGTQYYGKGEYPQAAVQFSNAIRVDPGYADAHFQLAETYLKLQQPDRACDEFAELLKLQPGDYKDRIEMANLLTASHRFAEAKEQTQLLLRIRPDDPAVHAAASALQAAQGNFPGAIAEMERTIELAPARWEPRLTLALLQFRNGQPDDGEATLVKVIAMSPSAVPPRTLLGNYYQSNHRFKEAEQQFRNAMAIDATDFEPRRGLASLYVAEGDKAAAEQVLQQAQHDFPHNPDVFLALSNFYFTNGDTDKAVAEYNALYQDRPADLQIEKKYIQLLIQVKRYDVARRLVNEILKADAGDDDALLYRSQMQISEGDIADAAQTLQSVVKEAPNNSEAHYALGVALDKQGFTDRAEGEWRQALSLNPNLLDAESALADAAMEQGDMNALQDAANQLIRLQPGAPEGYALRAVSNMNLNQYPQAEQDIHRAIEIAPQSAYGYVELGNLRILQKRYDEASAAYQQALERNAGSIDALRGLVNTLLAQKQIDQAIARIQKQIAKSPNDSNFYALLGSVLYHNEKDLSAAQGALEKSTALDRHNVDAWIQLTELLADRGESEQAVATGEQALMDNPHQPRLSILLGNLYESKADWKKAQDAYQNALLPSPQNPVASNDLARVMLHTGGSFDTALALAQTAHRALPESPGVADTLGWIYYQKGVYPLAVIYLQQALSLLQKDKLPDNPDIHYHLAMAYQKTRQTVLARQNFEQVLKIDPNYRSAPEIKRELSEL